MDQLEMFVIGAVALLIILSPVIYLTCFALSNGLDGKDPAELNIVEILSRFIPNKRNNTLAPLELLTDGMEPKNLMPLETFDNFECGKFHGSIQQRVRDENGHLYTHRDDLSDELYVAHVFKITLPPVEDMELYMKISISKWNTIKKHTANDLPTLTEWNIPDDELKKTFIQPNSSGLNALYKLFNLGPGIIQCHENEFTITLFNIKRLDDRLFTNDYWMIARKIFWLYARVAGLNLKTWRSPELNFDWWTYDLWVDDEENNSNSLHIN